MDTDEHFRRAMARLAEHAHADDHGVVVRTKMLPDQFGKLHPRTYVLYPNLKSPPPPDLLMDGMMSDFEPTGEQLTELLARGARDRRNERD